VLSNVFSIFWYFVFQYLIEGVSLTHTHTQPWGLCQDARPPS